MPFKLEWPSGPDFPYKGPYWAAETLPRGRDLTEDNLTLSLHFPYIFPYIFLTLFLTLSLPMCAGRPYCGTFHRLVRGPYCGTFHKLFADLTAGPFTSSLRTLLRDLTAGPSRALLRRAQARFEQFRANRGIHCVAGVLLVTVQ